MSFLLKPTLTTLLKPRPPAILPKPHALPPPPPTSTAIVPYTGGSPGTQIVPFSGVSPSGSTYSPSTPYASPGSYPTGYGTNVPRPPGPSPPFSGSLGGPGNPSSAQDPPSNTTPKPPSMLNTFATNAAAGAGLGVGMGAVDGFDPPMDPSAAYGQPPSGYGGGGGYPPTGYSVGGGYPFSGPVGSPMMSNSFACARPGCCCKQSCGTSHNSCKPTYYKRQYTSWNNKRSRFSNKSTRY